MTAPRPAESDCPPFTPAQRAWIEARIDARIEARIAEAMRRAIGPTLDERIAVYASVLRDSAKPAIADRWPDLGREIGEREAGGI